MSDINFKNFFRYMPRAEAQAVMISVLVGIAMLAVKAVAYLRTGSAAILSDALEQVVNIVASMFAAYSLSTAHRPRAFVMNALPSARATSRQRQP